MMKVDKKKTKEAQRLHNEGVIALNKLFRVSHVAHFLGAQAARPKKRGGLSKNRRRVLAGRQAQIRRAVLCSAAVYAKKKTG